MFPVSGAAQFIASGPSAAAARDLGERARSRGSTGLGGPLGVVGEEQVPEPPPLASALSSSMTGGWWWGSPEAAHLLGGRPARPGTRLVHEREQAVAELGGAGAEVEVHGYLLGPGEVRSGGGRAAVVSRPGRSRPRGGRCRPRRSSRPAAPRRRPGARRRGCATRWAAPSGMSIASPGADLVVDAVEGDDGDAGDDEPVLGPAVVALVARGAGRGRR